MIASPMQHGYATTTDARQRLIQWRDSRHNIPASADDARLHFEPHAHLERVVELERKRPHCIGPALEELRAQPSTSPQAAASATAVIASESARRRRRSSARDVVLLHAPALHPRADSRCGERVRHLRIRRQPGVAPVRSHHLETRPALRESSAASASKPACATALSDPQPIRFLVARPFTIRSGAVAGAGLRATRRRDEFHC